MNFKPILLDLQVPVTLRFSHLIWQAVFLSLFAGLGVLLLVFAIWYYYYNKRYQTRRAFYAFLKNDYQQCLRILERKKRWVAIDYKIAGICHANLNHLAEAANLLSQYHYQNHYDEDVNKLLSEIYYQRGDFQQFLYHIDLAVPTRKNYFQKVEAFLALGNIQEAQKIVRYLSVREQTAEVLYLQSRVYQENLATLLYYYEKSPTDFGAFQDEIHLHIGDAFLNQELYNEAKSFYDKVLRHPEKMSRVALFE